MPTKLGQNFLKDTLVVQKILTAAQIKSSDIVVEVGPGEGVLTKEMAKLARKIIAIEIDQNLVENLKKKFENKPNVSIINADILKINLPKLYAEQGITTEYKLVANLPYYITSPILRLFLETALPPQEMILMVQKEVAERIVAKPGKMSILAVSVQYYGQPELLFPVKNTSFSPIPAVDSAIIKISQLTTHNPQLTTKAFFRLVKAGFCAKRKTLANNLSSSLHFDKSEAENKLKLIGLNPLVRAQELSLEKWKELLEIL
jgi:16S rRNA (adenine1518-N6/adenine1519-N6)-dimethyltransferase